MQQLVTIGMGQLGQIFSVGALKLGYAVYPIRRGENLFIAQIQPIAVIVAVGEKDLNQVLVDFPTPWKNRIILIQNELLFHDWTTLGLSPTVASIWFEKKKGRLAKPLMPSIVFGNHAPLVQQLLNAVDLPCRQLDSEAALLQQLVLKNLYIVTTNVAGLALKDQATVRDLYQQHDLFEAVAQEVLNIQSKICKQHFLWQDFQQPLLEAFESDWDHVCCGRSALDRRSRALEQADQFKVMVPTMREVVK